MTIKDENWSFIKGTRGIFKGVILKVSPLKGVKRFSVKGILSPKYIGPFDII